MSDFLDIVVESVRETIKEGYYDVPPASYERRSLKGALQSRSRNPVVAEVKPASPSKGVIRKELAIEGAVSSMQRGGAAGISVLTEQKYFYGSLDNLTRIRKTTSLPLLMKDFFIDPAQIDAAAKKGADAVLLIQTLFDRGYCASTLQGMIEAAQSHGLEVLLEAHTEEEFRKAVSAPADLLGINNRDLATLDVDLHVTERILEELRPPNRLVVSESGIESPTHIRFLRNAGAHAFLVGSAVMSAANIEEKVRELVEA